MHLDFGLANLHGGSDHHDRAPLGIGRGTLSLFVAGLSGCLALVVASQDGALPNTRGGGLAAGTRQQGELGLLGGVSRPDDFFQC